MAASGAGWADVPSGLMVTPPGLAGGAATTTAGCGRGACGAGRGALTVPGVLGQGGRGVLVQAASRAAAHTTVRRATAAGERKGVMGAEGGVVMVAVCLGYEVSPRDGLRVAPAGALRLRPGEGRTALAETSDVKATRPRTCLGHPRTTTSAARRAGVACRCGEYQRP